MLKAILSGAVSAVALSGVALTATSLLLPTPTREARPDTTTPAAPLQADQSAALPSVPAPVPAPVVSPQAAAEDAAVLAPPDKAVAVEVPAASQFNRPPEDQIAVTPEADTPPPAAAVTEPVVPVPAGIEAPEPDTTSAAQPVLGQVSGFGAVPEAGDAPVLPAQPDEAAPMTFAALPDETPEDATAGETPAVETEAAVPATQVPAEAAAEPAPEVATPQAADAPDSPTDRIVAVETPAAQSPDLTRAEVETAEAAPAVVPERLILDSEAAATEATAEAARPRALDVFAADFDNPAGLPVLSVILIDDPDGGVAQASLAAIDFPVTFAIDPSRADAAAVAQTYRAAGFEVLLLADGLPQDAAPQDYEQAMVAALAAVPEAIGLLDRQAGPLARDREALAAVLPTLAEAGMGFVAYPEGLNAEQAEAEAAGVPAAVLYRVLDAENERATVLTRFLDRSTFEAEQVGATIVVGRTTSDMITALYSWQLGSRSNNVAVAPVSEILTGEGG